MVPSSVSATLYSGSRWMVPNRSTLVGAKSSTVCAP
jgi:hypothetical protein